MGLTWDEGPDIGGPYGPYRQSERSALYREHAQMLLDAGLAFRCFCTPEDLAQMRANEDPNGRKGYDGRCMNLSQDEIQARLDAGDPYVIRMVVPDEGVCTVEDMLRGTIEIAWREVDMQILLKSDGMPTYHLANVVDDHHMKITHVMRGEEWISSAPKHLLLYQYFGWEAPKLCHMPLLRNPDTTKLSKRKNPTSITYYERAGFMPEALVNYLGRMGWSMPDEREKFTLDEMIEAFDINRISLGGPIFDVAKLEWLNGKYIREDLDANAFADRVQNWAFNRDHLLRIAPLVQQRVNTFSDIAPLASFFLANSVELTAEQAAGGLEPDQAIKALQWTLWELDQLSVWDKDTVGTTLRSTADLMGLKLRDYIKPFYLAITGAESSTPLFDSMAILGKDLVRGRLRTSIKRLTQGKGLGKKKLKKLQKAYDRAKAEAKASAS
ncbi:MAG: glutamate--tRNA ligase [Myxococcota bacterium]